MSPEIVGKQLELLKETVPKASPRGRALKNPAIGAVEEMEDLRQRLRI